MQCGIIGLPNVGKSSLFNALTRTKAALSGNFPFCTIEPNVGIVEISDERLTKLAELAKSQKIIKSTINFVDIAGLVKGASKGEGLGNQFLSKVRDVDVLIHLVRCFDDEDIVHVNGHVDPVRDINIINDELIISDLELVEKRINSIEKAARINKNPDSKLDLEILNLCKKILENSISIYSYIKYLNDGSQNSLSSEIFKQDISGSNKDILDRIKTFGFITSKPSIYVANVPESDLLKGNNWSCEVEKMNSQFAIISVSIEEQISELASEEERQEYYKMLGIKTSGLSIIAEKCRNLLNLGAYFTVGPKEARSWNFKKGISAPQAAGIIHSDFEKGFIRAEVIKYEDFIELGSEIEVKNKGKMKLQGKDYIVQDGDIIHFRFNV